MSAIKNPVGDRGRKTATAAGNGRLEALNAALQNGHDAGFAVTFNPQAVGSLTIDFQNGKITLGQQK